MRIGRLKHRLIIEQPVRLRNETGEFEDTWQLYATVWAAIEPIRGKEALSGNQILGDLDTRIVIRWSTQADGIKATFRGRHQNVTYNFSTPAHHNVERREIEILAKSGRNNG